MKRILLLSFVVCFLLTSVLLAFDYPNIIGEWIGSSYGHGNVIMDDSDEVVYYDGRGLDNVHFHILEQEGRIFWGVKMVFDVNGDLVREEGFSGLFKKDSNHFHILEHHDGLCNGELISDNEMEIIYTENVTYPLMLIYELKRK